MYLIDYVNAYAAALALGEQEMDYALADALVVLKRHLAPHVEFFTREEMKLVQAFALLDEGGNVVLNERGSFTFREGSRVEEYAERRARLGAVEVQEAFTPITVPRPEKIKPLHLEALEKFLVFGEEG